MDETSRFELSYRGQSKTVELVGSLGWLSPKKVMWSNEGNMEQKMIS